MAVIGNSAARPSYFVDESLEGYKTLPIFYKITKEETEKYAEATMDSRRVFIGQESETATRLGREMLKTLLSSISIKSAYQLFCRPEFKDAFKHLVHGSQTCEFTRQAAMGDLLVLSGRVKKIIERNGLQTVKYDIWAENISGLAVAKINSTFVILPETAMPAKSAEIIFPEPNEENSPAFSFEEVRAGRKLFRLTQGPIEPRHVILYGWVTDDHNPIHFSDEAAKVAGLPRIIAHGLLTGSFPCQFLTRNLPGATLDILTEKFVKFVLPGDTITTYGEVVGKQILANGLGLVTCEFKAAKQTNEVVLAGSATLVFPKKGNFAERR